ncbi:DsbA family protein [methane-oxidizing endosymbiont of Gigantopelta aegis]|uniref:DsbA family protein n=1 Tax=methane-oxidizing endosymbiont of Gigantopelta aegis TaxID=2794938 RepID=UPI0018DE8123|nr:DsbA family protein [methane-oxidizing endosymbiont of Gigantopelta aegis]
MKLKSIILLSSTLFVTSVPIIAAEKNTDLQSLKQQLLTELLQSPQLKKIIRDEIVAQEKQKALTRIQKRLEKKKRQQQHLHKHLQPVNPKQDHIYGNPNAPISVIEYSDFECPYCRKIHPTLKRLVDDSKGTINWVFRHMPADFHQPNARQEAEAAECAANLAGNDGFWRFAEKLFQHPRRNKQSHQYLIRQAAKRSNIDADALMKCLEQRRFKEKVEKNIEETKLLKLVGTPANILIHHPSGRLMLRQGAASLLRLRLDIAQLSAPNKKPGL